MARPTTLVALGVMFLGASVCRATEKHDGGACHPNGGYPVACCANGSDCGTGGKSLGKWLTYQPLRHRGACGKDKGEPCCTPPLYAFFLCHASGCGTNGCHAEPAVAGEGPCQASCAATDCGRCGGRGRWVRSLWDRVVSPLSWITGSGKRGCKAGSCGAVEFVH